MTTTKQQIADWFKSGLGQGATHMVVVCDTFDHQDYPVYVMPGEDPHKMDPKGENMQRAMECYDLRMSMEDQLSETRAHHWDP